jgi:hypothetical protein
METSSRRSTPTPSKAALSKRLRALWIFDAGPVRANLAALIAGVQVIPFGGQVTGMAPAKLLVDD